MTPRLPNSFRCVFSIKGGNGGDHSSNREPSEVLSHHLNESQGSRLRLEAASETGPLLTGPKTDVP